VRIVLTIADTAYSIAAVRAEESAKPAAERLFDDPFAALFYASGAHAEEGTQRYLALPFFREGIRLRTRFLDDALRAGLAAGIDQVVLLGAGFDARGLRMPEIAAKSARVWEVDLPAQIERKRAVLANARIVVPDRIAFVGFDFARADFEEALASDLVNAGFRAGGGAIFVWEGVIGYIDSNAIDASLRFMARAGGRGTRVGYTSGEGAFAPETPEERMRRCGYRECAEIGLDVMWRRHFPGEPHPGASFSKVGVAIV
jgi:methyltransferase (TIGR00027 family)